MSSDLCKTRGEGGVEMQHLYVRIVVQLYTYVVRSTNNFSLVNSNST